MPLRVLQADLFSVKSEALLLTIDGARRGLEGNLARQFARLSPDDWEDVGARFDIHCHWAARCAFARTSIAPGVLW